MHVHGFPPVADARSAVLILGTMPGKASLRASEYYAHPRNLFWTLMGTFLGFAPDLPYPERLRCLTGARVALWDVLCACTRTSSLDSDIDPASVVPNDFSVFFREHASIRHVFFNGAKAEALYERHVVPHTPAGASMARRRLPSTSPANASIPFDKKLREWRRVVHEA